jgi:hypothetical protein
LINLLSNAIKFLDNRPERTITLTLSASTTPPKPDAVPLHSPEPDADTQSQDLYLSFSINDTGPGLKEAEMAALFQRFQQATPRTHVTYGGSGLGLFISKRLVELQGGRIYVDSVEGKGSTFSFFIKVGKTTAIGGPKQAPFTTGKGDQVAATVHEEDGNQTHVLVVEVSILVIVLTAGQFDQPAVTEEAVNRLRIQGVCSKSWAGGYRQSSSLSEFPQRENPYRSHGR